MAKIISDPNLQNVVRANLRLEAERKRSKTRKRVEKQWRKDCAAVHWGALAKLK